MESGRREKGRGKKKNEMNEILWEAKKREVRKRKEDLECGGEERREWKVEEE